MLADVRSCRQSDPAPGPALGDPRSSRWRWGASATRSSRSRPRRPDRERRPRRRHLRSPGNLRRSAAGRRPARLLRRAGDDPGLQRPAVLELPRRLPRHDPELTEDYARAGDVKLLYRHYSNSENPIELGFYGAEAAAEQGYGWQYTYLFFRNQEEVKGGSEARFERLPRLGRRWRRGTELARMGIRVGRKRQSPTVRSRSGSKGYEELGERPRHPHSDRRRSSTGRAAPRRSRTARSWVGSNGPSKKCSNRGERLNLRSARARRLRTTRAIRS